MFKTYFSTPISIKENFLQPDIHKNLLQLINNLKKDSLAAARSWHSPMNLLHEKSDCIEYFEKTMIENFKEFHLMWLKQNEQEQYQLESQDRPEDIDYLEEQQTYSVFSWAFASKADSFCEPHVHPFAILTAVYYLQMPTGLKSPEGCIEFLNPMPGATQSRPISNFEKLLIKPKENSLLIFPAYMHHWAHPFRNNHQERIIIGTDYCTNLPSYVKSVNSY